MTFLYLQVNHTSYAVVLDAMFKSFRQNTSRLILEAFISCYDNMSQIRQRVLEKNFMFISSLSDPALSTLFKKVPSIFG